MFWLAFSYRNVHAPNDSDVPSSNSHMMFSLQRRALNLKSKVVLDFRISIYTNFFYEFVGMVLFRGFCLDPLR